MATGRSRAVGIAAHGVKRNGDRVPSACPKWWARGVNGGRWRSTETPCDLRLRARPLITNLADPALQAGGRGFESHRLHNPHECCAPCSRLPGLRLAVRSRGPDYALRRENGHPVRVDAEPLVRSPEITDAQQIAWTKNDSWRVGYRGLLPDSMLDGLDDAWAATQWVHWVRDGYEDAGQRAEVRVTTDAERQVVGVSAFGADRDLPNDAKRGELWVIYVAPCIGGAATGTHCFAMQRSARRGGTAQPGTVGSGRQRSGAEVL